MKRNLLAFTCSTFSSRFQFHSQLVRTVDVVASLLLLLLLVPPVDVVSLLLLLLLMLFRCCCCFAVATPPVDVVLLLLLYRCCYSTSTKHSCMVPLTRFGKISQLCLNFEPTLANF